MELWGLTERKDNYLPELVPMGELAPENTLGTVTDKATDTRVVYVDRQIIVEHVLKNSLNGLGARVLCMKYGTYSPKVEDLKEWATEHNARK